MRGEQYKNIIIKGTCGTLGKRGPLTPCTLPHYEPNVLHNNKRTANNWLTASGYLDAPRNPQKRMQFGGKISKIVWGSMWRMSGCWTTTAATNCSTNLCGLYTHTHTYIKRTLHTITYSYTLTHTHTHVVKTSVCIQIKRQPILWKSPLNAYLMLSTITTTAATNLNKS